VGRACGVGQGHQATWHDQPSTSKMYSRHEESLEFTATCHVICQRCIVSVKVGMTSSNEEFVQCHLPFCLQLHRLIANRAAALKSVQTPKHIRLAPNVCDKHSIRVAALPPRSLYTKSQLPCG